MLIRSQFKALFINKPLDPNHVITDITEVWHWFESCLWNSNRYSHLHSPLVHDRSLPRVEQHLRSVHKASLILLERRAVATYVPA